MTLLFSLCFCFLKFFFVQTFLPRDSAPAADRNSRREHFSPQIHSHSWHHGAVHIEIFFSFTLSLILKYDPTKRISQHRVDSCRGIVQAVSEEKQRGLCAPRSLLHLGEIVPLLWTETSFMTTSSHFFSSKQPALLHERQDFNPRRLLFKKCSRFRFLFFIL